VNNTRMCSRSLDISWTPNEP